MPRDRQPERMCVGCRGKGEKRALLRIARRPDGTIVVDPSGRSAGRGAYVHRDAACVESALASGGLFRALREGAAPDAAARLRQDIEGELRA